jgi:high mobility group protein B1
MEPEEKEEWEAKARKDKARYEVEKAMYKGPWKVPANKRTPKDPSAPKRPMSAFLAFSNKRRAGLKKQNPDATNADLSKMLSRTWKEAPQELRQKYMDEEAILRAKYKEEMAMWRKKAAEEKKIERQEREAMAMQAAENRQNEGVNVGSANAAGSQFARAPGDMGVGFGGGSLPGQNISQDMGTGTAGSSGMSGAAQMYGNPYAMAAAGAGDLSGFGMQAPNAAQYANLMAAGNPYAAQSFLGAANAASAQQQLLTQLFGKPTVKCVAQA